jgi:Carboxypeptidase regulatory-like domain
MRTLAICAMVLGLAASAAMADPPMVKLRIEVKTLGGKPIDRASVIVRFAEGRDVMKLLKKHITNWETATNQAGVVKIPEVPQGKIRIQVIAKGYQTFGQIFEVRETEKTIEIKLNPPQPQFSAHD